VIIGATVIDTGMTPERRGTITAVDAERLDVIVTWRPGMVTTLRPADIRAGRYRIVLPTLDQLNVLR
jgi:hypothetical protein